MQRNQNSSRGRTAVSVAAATDIVPFFIISKITRWLSFLLWYLYACSCCTVVHQSITCHKEKNKKLLLLLLCNCDYNTPFKIVNEATELFTKKRGEPSRTSWHCTTKKIDELSSWIVIALLGTANCKKKVNYSRISNQQKRHKINWQFSFNVFCFVINAISKPFDKTGTTIIDEVFEENKSLDSSFCNQRMAEGKRQHKKCFLRGKKTGEEEARRWWWLNIIKDILSASVFFFLSFFPFSFFCVVCYWPFWPQ